MSRIKKNLSYNIIQKLVDLLFPLLTLPLLSRNINPENLGSVFYADSIVCLFLIFAGMGLPIYAVRILSETKDSNELFRKSNELFILNLLFACLSSFIYLIIVFKINLEYKNIYYILTLKLLFSGFSCEWYYIAKEQFKYIAIRGIVIKLSSLVLILLFINSNDDHYIYTWILVFISMIPNIINFIKFIHITKSNFNIGIKELKLHLKPVFLLSFGQFATVLYMYVDKIMIGSIVGKDSVAFYTMGLVFVRKIVIVLMSLNTVILPQIYSLNKSNKTEYFGLISNSLKLNFMVAIPSVMGLIILSQSIVDIFLNSQYESSVLVIQISSGLLLTGLLQHTFGFQLLLSNKKENLFITSLLIGVGTNIFLNFLLIPSLSIYGASIASLSSEVVVVIFQVYFCRDIIRKLHINITTKFFYFLFSLSFIPIYILLKTVISNMIIRLSIFVIIAILTYFIFLVILKDDVVIPYIRLKIKNIRKRKEL